MPPADPGGGFVLRSTRVVTPAGVLPAQVVVRGGRIADLLAGAAPPPADLPLRELGTLVLSPGLVDAHVHINEPGRTEWEGFATATRAAAAGGVTTLVDMPLNSRPPTTSLEALAAKRAAAEGRVHVDVAFWGGITDEVVRVGAAARVAALAAAGVCGFKLFLADSGVPEYGSVDAAGLREALAAVAPTGLPVIVHAEAPAVLAGAPAPAGRSYAAWEASRPPQAEVAAIRLLAALAGETGARAHVLHLSAAESLPLLTQAWQAGVLLSAETCPHYLSLAAEDIPDGATLTKCAPPIRGRANRERLWEALKEGLISCVVSDHSPAPPRLKAVDTGDFGTAWGGISGLQTQLPVVWTEARQRGFGLADLARVQSAAPAALAGLPGKGAIAVGRDADLVAWDPDASFVLDAADLRYRHPQSPWTGRELFGVVDTVWLSGRELTDGGAPAGRLLRRGVA